MWRWWDGNRGGRLSTRPGQLPAGYARDLYRHRCAVCTWLMQLSLLHIPAVVVHGNALTLDVWGMWYTPAHSVGGWKWKLPADEADVEAAELVRIDEAAADALVDPLHEPLAPYGRMRRSRCRGFWRVVRNLVICEG